MSAADISTFRASQILPDSVAATDPGVARLPRVNPREVAEMLRQAPAMWPEFSPVDDREAWRAVANRLGEARVGELVAAAQARVREPIPQLRQSWWRDFRRTGDRIVYQQAWYARRAILADLVLGYCLRPDDAVLDAVVDLIWAICEETSWCFPAHDPGEFPDPAQPVVDLFASLTAVSLGELSTVLGPALPQQVHDRIRDQSQERVITPYLLKDTWRWMYRAPRHSVNNWTAVCAFGSVGAACYLEEDPDRLASMICKAARSLEDYLEAFDPDGGTSEGTGYWGFGFGSFCQLADLVHRRTGGALDWLVAPIVARVAEFPLRSRLTRDSWPTFSDSDPGVHFNGPLLLSLGARFDIPDLRVMADTPVAAWGWTGNSAVTTAFRSIWAGPVGTGQRPLPVPADTSEWFSGLQWLLSRVDSADPETLAVAVKGGHNGEMHNQNDVGSLTVRLGGENLIVDPGRGLYTRDYFNEHRYEHFVNRSYGHSVPLPAGVEQATGATAHAMVAELERGETDRVRYDLTAAYPNAPLESLYRTVELHRGGAPAVLVSDEFAFTEAGVAESAFVTFADVRVAGDRVVVAGEQASLTIELPAGCHAELHRETVALSSGPREVTRIAVRTAEPVHKATLEVWLRPA